MNFNDAASGQGGGQNLTQFAMQTRAALNQLIEQASRDIKTLADAVTTLQKGMVILQREHVALKAQLLAATVANAPRPVPSAPRMNGFNGAQAVRTQAQRPQTIELNSPGAARVVESPAWTQGADTSAEEDAELTSGDDAFYSGGE